MENKKYLVDRSYIIDGTKVWVRIQGVGCFRCVFNDGQGAKVCKYAGLCMAHLRMDRRSVVFVSSKCLNQ